MNSDHDHSGDRARSPSVRDVLDAKHGLSVEAAQALDPSALAELEELAAGSERPLTGDVSIGSRVKALTALALAGRVRATQLLSLAADDAEDVGLRTAAALNLRQLPADEAEPALVRLLGVRDPQVLAGVLKALGAVGGPANLAVLDALPALDSPMVSQQLALTRTLIAFRSGLDRLALKLEPPGAAGAAGSDEPVALAVSLIGPDAVSHDLSRLEDSHFGIALDGARGATVVFGSSRWTLFLNAEMVAAGSPAAALRLGPRLLGLLARWQAETDTCAVQYLVLSQPIDTAVYRILAVRTDGEVQYVGEAVPDAAGVSFAVTAMRRRRSVPVEVRGRVGTGVLEVAARAPIDQLEVKRQASPIPRDA